MRNFIVVARDVWRALRNEAIVMPRLGPVFVLAFAGCVTKIEAPPATVDAPPLAPDALPPYQIVSKYGLDLIRSVTVDKGGGSVRIVYIEAPRIAEIAATGPLPDGTRLIMDVNLPDVFVIEKTSGAPRYATFPAVSNPPVVTTQPNSQCDSCHLGAAEAPIFTASSVRRLVATHHGEDIACRQPDPCSPDVYR